MKINWLNSHFEKINGFSFPNWQTVDEHINDELLDVDQHNLWTQIANRWVDIMIADLDDGYTANESENFIVVSNVDANYSNRLIIFLEQCLKRILKTLPSIASNDIFGKHVVFVFADNDRYYDYICNFGPQEGTYGLTTGMYLNYGYGHFVFPHQEIDYTFQVVAHELTHALLNHLPIPTWLNEGLAMNMESMLTGGGSFIYKEKFNMHQRFWGFDEIQEFWQGTAFGRPDEGQELSYHLAQVLVANISENKNGFTKFANLANWQDGGEAAMSQVFDLSLGDLIDNFLGEGNWWPQPEKWQTPLATDKT